MSKDKTNSSWSAFETSVYQGLSRPIKNLSSRYFYDDEGSRLFRKIMEMPEYYLTDAEFEILHEQASSIHQALGFSKEFNIVELGAGDGKKTIRLLDYLQKENIPFTYMPIDISQEAINMLIENVAKENSQVNVKPLVGDYFDMLGTLKDEDKPTLLLFLGSNLGNFHLKDAYGFIASLSEELKKGDKLLLGIDLQKNPHTIRNAYNDEGGITRAFNLNLLKRINRELNGNFDLNYWDFYSTYNPINGEVRSYLISLIEQEVTISNLETTFYFKKDELIYTELSRKYTLTEIDNLAKQAGMKIIKHFHDKKNLFADSIMGK